MDQATHPATPDGPNGPSGPGGPDGPDGSRGHRRRSVAPVLFVPGIGHATRGWELLRRHLGRSGFADVGALSGLAGVSDVPTRAEILARRVDTLLELCGTDRLHLVGHHVGGVVARWFVQVMGGDRVTRTLVTVGTPHHGTDPERSTLGPAAAQLRPGSAVLRHLDESARPLDTRVLNYCSERDPLVEPPSSGLVHDPLVGATNILVDEHPNLSVVLPAVVCRSIAHELAAAEGLLGDARPVSTLPGGVVRLGGDRPVPVSPAAIAAARADHPSAVGVQPSPLTGA